MKKLLLLFSAALTMLFTGCMQFDDTRIWDAIDELEDLFKDLDDRVEDLEEACEKMNTNIEALQTLVAALQANDTITSIAPIKQGDKVVGYTISFSKSEPITIYHGNDGKDGTNGTDGKDGQDGENGKDGKDGYTPTIGVAQEDGVYYWTLDGEWLLDDNGNKIKAVGTDGKDGADGEDGKDGANGEDGKDGENGTNGENGKDGEDGADGKDGITPQLEIRDGYWYISYDNGATWKELGKATGEDGKDGADGEDGKDGKDGEDGTNGTDGQDGKDGDSLFQSVTWDEENVYFTLADGSVITIPLADGAVTKEVEVIAVEMIGLCEDNTCAFILTNSGFNQEAEDWSELGYMTYNSGYYTVYLMLETIEDSSVVPQGTFTSEAGEIDIRDGSCYEYLGDNWDDWDYFHFDNAVVTVSENKIEGTFTLRNGEVHHVVYEGSLELYFRGITDVENGEEEGDLPPANEIWYTSTDGEVVTPSWEQIDIWGNIIPGVNIVSNTYDNGKGVITFDDDVTSIEYQAFVNCSSLASITIPEGVTSIRDCAFWNCSSLESVTIPNSVTSIEVGAFWNCSSLESVYCKPTTPPAGGNGMFSYSGDGYPMGHIGCKIYVPTESVEAYKSAEYWSEYADDIVGYDFGGNSGDTDGVKEVAANCLWGAWYAWDETKAGFTILGAVSDKLFEYNPSNDSWSYCFMVFSDTEPINDEVPLGTYTYVDYEKLVNGEEELKTGIFIHLVEAEWHCIYTDANGEMQEYKYTEGTIVVSDGKIELTVTLDNGEVHHVVYEGSLQTWGEAA